MVQFDIIYKLNNKWLRGDTIMIIVVLYHKHKVLGITFLERRVWIFLEGNVCPWFNGVPVRGKKTWFIVTGISLLFLLTMLSKVILDRIVFKYVIFFIKYLIFLI